MCAVMVEKQFSVCDQFSGGGGGGGTYIYIYISVPKGEQAEGDVNELHVLYLLFENCVCSSPMLHSDSTDINNQKLYKRFD